jgi:alpha-ketoglutarate-dependent taurine dioxygenase
MSAISVEPLSDQPLGAIVRGLSASRSLSDADFRVVEQALLDHLAIVVPDLDEGFDWLIDLGRRFGPLVPHILTQYHHPRTPEMSIITANMGNAESRRTAKPAGAFWHSDLSYCADPSDAILLYATHVPRDGGDTLVANMHMAWEALPERLKRRIEGRIAIHRYGWNGGGAITEPDPARRAQYPDVEHPLVRVHPRTGRRLLFANPGYTMCVKDMDRAESDALLAAVFEHALDPAFQYRHRWSARQLVAIDNRACLHCAVGGYREPMRKLRMIVGCTERPAAA